MSFIQMAEERFSVRKFKSDPIPDEVLDKILSVVKMAPTACNNQPQKVYVVKSPEVLAKLKTLSPCTFDAPVVLMVGYDTTLAARGRVKYQKPHHDFGELDASIVGTHLMFAAQEMGLGSCWVGYFTGPDVVSTLGLPETFQPMLLLPIGYPADDCVPNPAHTKSRAFEDMVSVL